jgi:inhibitor of the pro-sigma K processing machinery
VPDFGHATLLLWIGIVLVALFVLSQLVRYPKQILWKVVRTGVFGCLFIFAVNWVGQYFHFHLPFNTLTAVTAGLLGIPGVAALITLQLWVFQ